MERLFLTGIVWVFLAGACIAAEPIERINQYDPGKLHELADRIALGTKDSLDKAFTPSEVNQILKRAQVDYLRILIRQNDALIQQNDEAIRLLRRIPRQ